MTVFSGSWYRRRVRLITGVIEIVLQIPQTPAEALSNRGSFDTAYDVKLSSV